MTRIRIIADFEFPSDDFALVRAAFDHIAANDFVIVSHRFPGTLIYLATEEIIAEGLEVDRKEFPI